jgi:hypothetical protein
MKARGINCLYVVGFTDSRYGGDGPADGNPFVNANITGNIDADILNQWYGWFQNNVSITTSRRVFTRPAGIQAECALSIAKQ